MHAVKELCQYHTCGITCLGKTKIRETLIRFWISRAPKVTGKLPMTKTCNTFHISKVTLESLQTGEKPSPFECESFFYVLASLDTSCTRDFLQS